MRTVIAHYHIFKNSGTTFDALLTENYGDKHLLFDGPFPFFVIDQERFSQIVMRKGDIVAFSSHQIRLPVPASLAFRVLPVIFIRHPLLRILSIYTYKRKVEDGTSISVLAERKTFDEWVDHCLSDKKEISHISNSQTRILGAVYGLKPLFRRQQGVVIGDLEQAIRNINNVELLARTEFFDQDVKHFPAILGQYEIPFQYFHIDPKNTTSANIQLSLEERLDDMCLKLSMKNYRRLLKANEQDLSLFEYASTRIETNGVSSS